MPTQYTFTTQWHLKAPVEKVWRAIHESLDWPEWWKGVVSVTQQEPGDARGLGSIRTYTWKSILPYTLCFRMRLTAVHEMSMLRGRASGELEGDGEWRFSETQGVTRVEYHWRVVTNKQWMNTLSFLLKPVFRYNHNIVMRWGAEGLARKLGAELIRY